MSTYPEHVWKQLKSISKDELCSALIRDGWQLDVISGGGSMRIYRKGPGRRVVVHYHSQTTCGPKLLKELLDDIGWDVADMRRLKLVR